MSLPSPIPRWPSDHDGPFVAHIDATWGQGRAIYGGVLAEAGLRAMRAGVVAERHLRSVLMTFISPAEPGAVEVVVDPLRSGRAITLVRAELRQGGRRFAELVAAWGEPRGSTLEVEGPPPPAVSHPSTLPPMPDLPGIIPAFTQHFDYRWTTDCLPFTGAERAHIQGWVRPRGPQPVDDITVVALLDAWPLPVLSLARRPVPASSVTWQVNLVRPLPTGGVSPEAFWLTDSHTRVAAEGYADLDMRLWDEAGRLVALSRQLVVEFSA